MIGILYIHLGKYEKAKPLLQHSLNVRQKFLGSAHLHTIRVRRDLEYVIDEMMKGGKNINNYINAPKNEVKEKQTHKEEEIKDKGIDGSIDNSKPEQIKSHASEENERIESDQKTAQV